LSAFLFIFKAVKPLPRPKFDATVTSMNKSAPDNPEVILLPKLLSDERMLELLDEQPEGWKIHELYQRVLAEAALAEAALAEAALAEAALAEAALRPQGDTPTAGTVGSDQPQNDPLAELVLFRRNFLLMHQLFKLSEDLETKKAGYLSISCMDIHRVRDSQAGGTCQTGWDCQHAQAGDTTRDKTAQLLDGTLRDADQQDAFLPAPREGLAAYYLDAVNFFDTSEEEVRQLLDSFWTRLEQWQHRTSLLERLGLDPELSQEDLKQRMRSLAKAHHPDAGGDSETFMTLWRFWEDSRAVKPGQSQPRSTT